MNPKDDRYQYLNYGYSVLESFSSFPLELDGGDQKSDRDIADRRIRYEELAAFMNADPDEIGMLPILGSYVSLFYFCASLYL